MDAWAVADLLQVTFSFCLSNWFTQWFCFRHWWQLLSMHTVRSEGNKNQWLTSSSWSKCRKNGKISILKLLDTFHIETFGFLLQSSSRYTKSIRNNCFPMKPNNLSSNHCKFLFMRMKAVSSVSSSMKSSKHWQELY
jgi:hypothetical protein